MCYSLPRQVEGLVEAQEAPIEAPTPDSIPQVAREVLRDYLTGKTHDGDRADIARRVLEEGVR